MRNARVDGVPFRRRFTYRDDSLWWFAELYLHKQQVVLNIFKTVAALDALLDREQPSAIGLEQADPGIAPVVAQFAVARGVQFSGLNEGGPSLARLAAMDARASWLQAGALASRTRRHPIASRHRTASVLAFVHRAFWRTEADDGTAEQVHRSGPESARGKVAGWRPSIRQRRTIGELSRTPLVASGDRRLRCRGRGRARNRGICIP